MKGITAGAHSKSNRQGNERMPGGWIWYGKQAAGRASDSRLAADPKMD
jgi:hypothetical protein